QVTNHQSRLGKSFIISSYANRPILHYLGATKSFRIRSYRNRARNSFRMRSYKNTQGVASPLSTFPSIPSAHFPNLRSVSLCWRLPRPGRGGKSSPLSPFRINTYISVASKRLYLPLESTLMKKGGEGGGYG